MQRRVLAFAAPCAAVLAFACGWFGSEAARRGDVPLPPIRPASVPPPAESPLAQLRPGMSDAEVRAILGEPTLASEHMTDKELVPYHYGSDTRRTEWSYAGLGRVVFKRDSESVALWVVRIDYDPSETGDRGGGR